MRETPLYNGIRLVVCDLDGTLLDPDGNIGDERIEAIIKLKNSGIDFAVATGRPFNDIDPKLRSCEAIRFFITSNGAAVVDRLGKLTENTLLDGTTVNEIYNIVKPYIMTVSLHSAHGSFVDAEKITPDGFRRFGTSKYYQKYYSTLSVALPDFDGFISSVSQAEMMSIYFKSESDCDECLVKIGQISGISVTSSSKGNIEIISQGVGKGAALSELIDSLGINTSSVAAVGDSKNDISMFKVVGVPLAMANACEELKVLAKDVICSNNQNTAAYLTKLFL